MSWTDKKALEQIIKLRDYYNISSFIETGTFKGVNAAVHANNFKTVITCEKIEEYYLESKKKLSSYKNIELVHDDSVHFLSELSRLIITEYISPMVFIYLDAHFYDPTLKPEDRWVVIKELQALKNLYTCVIAIHDFDCNGLGHLIYDGQNLNFELLKPYLYGVNPNFHFYGNTKETCDILTKERVAAGEIPNLILDAVTDDNLTYVWSNEIKTYRGILYCTPTALDLTKFDLTPLEVK